MQRLRTDVTRMSDGHKVRLKPDTTYALLIVTYALLIAAIALIAGVACGRPPDDPAEPGTVAPPQRIVSIVPATTEMLFAMGAGARVVGVGSHDRYPPDVERIPRVGGLIDPNTERILGLKPDLVIVYGTQTALIEQLTRADIPMFVYEHQALDDIMATVRSLGTRVGASQAAESLAAAMERSLAEVRSSVAGRTPPRTLLVFGRDPGTLRGINASGGYGFLADLLEVAGGSNVFADVPRQSVQTSTEMVLSLAPEAIIELRYGDSVRNDGPAALDAWRALPSVPAVRDRRVHILTGDEFVVPGPRITIAAQRLKEALHPN